MQVLQVNCFEDPNIPQPKQWLETASWPCERQVAKAENSEGLFAWSNPKRTQTMGFLAAKALRAGWCMGDVHRLPLCEGAVRLNVKPVFLL